MKSIVRRTTNRLKRLAIDIAFLSIPTLVVVFGSLLGWLTLRC